MEILNYIQWLWDRSSKETKIYYIGFSLVISSILFPKDSYIGLFITVIGASMLVYVFIKVFIQLIILHSWNKYKEEKATLFDKLKE